MSEPPTEPQPSELEEFPAVAAQYLLLPGEEEAHPLESPDGVARTPFELTARAVRGDGGQRLYSEFHHTANAIGRLFLGAHLRDSVSFIYAPPRTPLPVRGNSCDLMTAMHLRLAVASYLRPELGRRLRGLFCHGDFDGGVAAPRGPFALAPVGDATVLAAKLERLIYNSLEEDESKFLVPALESGAAPASWVPKRYKLEEASNTQCVVISGSRRLTIRAVADLAEAENVAYGPDGHASMEALLEEVADKLGAGPLARLRRIPHAAEREQLASDFTGRKALLAGVTAWLADGTAPQLAVLSGPAGAGKSAVMARVFEEQSTRVRAAHFINTRLSDTADPLAFARSVARHLADADASYRRALSRVVGGLAEADAPCFFRRAVCDLLRDAGSSPVLLVVDALDEGPRVSKLLLEGVRDLPERVRVLVSARTESLAELGLPRHQRFPIEVTGEENLADLRELLSRKGWSAEQGTVLLEKSEGNVLYLTEALRDLKPESATPQELRKLPAGLERWYLDKFERLFPEARDGVNPWKDFLPLAELLLAARDGMTAAGLATALGAPGVDATAVASRMRVASSYFPSEGGSYVAFHKSLADWLTSDRAGRFRVEARRGHQALRAVCGRWADLGEQDTDARSYLLRHATEHLLASGAAGGLYSLLKDTDFLARQCEVLKRRRESFHALKAATDALLGEMSTPETDARLCWLALRTHELTGQGNVEALAAFDKVREGAVSEAVALLDTYWDPEHLVASLVCLWRELDRQQGLPAGDRSCAGAEMILRGLSRRLGDLSLAPPAARLLARLVARLLTLFPTARAVEFVPRAGDAFARALARGLQQWEDAEALRVAFDVVLLATRGNKSAIARVVAVRLRELPASPTTQELKTRLLSWSEDVVVSALLVVPPAPPREIASADPLAAEVHRMASQCRDVHELYLAARATRSPALRETLLRRALACARTGDRRTTDRLLGRLVRALVEAGMVDALMSTVGEASGDETPGGWAEALSRALTARPGSGVEGLIKRLGALGRALRNEALLLEAAYCAAAHGLDGEARALFPGTGGYGRSPFVSAVARGLVRTGRYEEAVAAIGEVLTDDGEYAVVPVVRSLALRGRVAESQDLLSRYLEKCRFSDGEEAWSTGRLRADLSAALAEGGEVEAALGLLTGEVLAGHGAEPISGIARALGSRAAAPGTPDALANLVALARQVNSSAARMSALAALAGAAKGLGGTPAARLLSTSLADAVRAADLSSETHAAWRALVVAAESAGDPDSQRLVWTDAWQVAVGLESLADRRTLLYAIGRAVALDLGVAWRSALLSRVCVSLRDASDFEHPEPWAFLQVCACDPLLDEERGRAVLELAFRDASRTEEDVGLATTRAYAAVGLLSAGRPGLASPLLHSLADSLKDSPQRVQAEVLDLLSAELPALKVGELLQVVVPKLVPIVEGFATTELRLRGRLALGGLFHAAGQGVEAHACLARACDLLIRPEVRRADVGRVARAVAACSGLGGRDELLYRVVERWLQGEDRYRPEVEAVVTAALRDTDSSFVEGTRGERLANRALHGLPWRSLRALRPGTGVERLFERLVRNARYLGKQDDWFRLRSVLSEIARGLAAAAPFDGRAELFRELFGVVFESSRRFHRDAEAVREIGEALLDSVRMDARECTAVLEGALRQAETSSAAVRFEGALELAVLLERVARPDLAAAAAQMASEIETSRLRGSDGAHDQEAEKWRAGRTASCEARRKAARGDVAGALAALEALSRSRSQNREEIQSAVVGALLRRRDHAGAAELAGKPEWLSEERLARIARAVCADGGVDLAFDVASRVVDTGRKAKLALALLRVALPQVSFDHGAKLIDRTLGWMQGVDRCAALGELLLRHGYGDAAQAIVRENRLAPAKASAFLRGCLRASGRSTPESSLALARLLLSHAACRDDEQQAVGSLLRRSLASGRQDGLERAAAMSRECPSLGLAGALSVLPKSPSAAPDSYCARCGGALDVLDAGCPACGRIELGGPLFSAVWLAVLLACVFWVPGLIDSDFWSAAVRYGLLVWSGLQALAVLMIAWRLGERLGRRTREDERVQSDDAPRAGRQ